jgi:hypothetical protein
LFSYKANFCWLTDVTAGDGQRVGVLVTPAVKHDAEKDKFSVPRRATIVPLGGSRTFPEQSSGVIFHGGEGKWGDFFLLIVPLGPGKFIKLLPSSRAPSEIPAGTSVTCFWNDEGSEMTSNGAVIGLIKGSSGMGGEKAAHYMDTISYKSNVHKKDSSNGVGLCGAPVFFAVEGASYKIQTLWGLHTAALEDRNFAVSLPSDTPPLKVGLDLLLGSSSQ